MSEPAVPIEVVLFDLDGTLVDTAPDLAAAVNRQRLERGLAELPLEALRPFASHGARGLIGRAFGLAPGEPDYQPLRRQFLAYYEQALCVHSRLFPGMDETLDALERRGRRWGVVTNKAARFTDPLLAALGLAQRAACVVSGDTTAFAKPHPEPLLHALRLCGGVPARTAYVGDDLRDVQAGRAAGVVTVVARYGYLSDGSDGSAWGGDFAIAQPRGLLELPGLAV
ncbi:MAG: phosphoglycolate phosphatase [Burkholderiaceae bacterium]